MNNGHVVSTSFVQSEALMQTLNLSYLVVPMSIKRQEHHPSEVRLLPIANNSKLGLDV